MPFTLTMPKLSPTMAEGTIAKWHKKVGDFVEAGDLLVEIATDKATIEYNALDQGFLRRKMAENGEKVAVNAPLAIFTEEEKETIDNYEPESVTPPPPTVAQKKVESPKPQPKPIIAPKPQPAPKKVLEKKERLLVSPLAKTLAKERGINLSEVRGSGPHGRILSRDLEGAPASEAEEITEIEEIPLSPMRQIIAERLQYSKSTIPHFYVRIDVEVDALVKLRDETKKFDLNLTINDFIVKAVATALKRHPNINSGFNPEAESIVRYPHVDLAIAVTIAGGLITPIVKRAETKSLQMISSEIKALAQRAKDGKLLPEEYQGGSFSISNLGMFGVTDFQAIVNPPQSAILAVGTIRDLPVVKNGAVVPGKMLALTLSCDHRAIDGSEAASFLQTLKQLIENPVLFLSD